MALTCANVYKNNHPNNCFRPLGTSSGLGRSIVEAALASGDKVIATSRTLDKLQSCVGTHPETCRIMQLDVTADFKAIQAKAQEAINLWGRVDVLVNNAGYTLAGEAEAAEDAEARAVFDTNFWGMVNVSKRCLQIMREDNAKNGQQGGVIMNVTSVGGYVGFPGQAFYHTSKFAVEGWTESVAKEVPSTWNSKCSLLSAQVLLVVPSISKSRRPWSFSSSM